MSSTGNRGGPSSRPLRNTAGCVHSPRPCHTVRFVMLKLWSHVWAVPRGASRAECCGNVSSVTNYYCVKAMHTHVKVENLHYSYAGTCF